MNSKSSAVETEASHLNQHLYNTLLQVMESMQHREQLLHSIALQEDPLENSLSNVLENLSIEEEIELDNFRKRKLLQKSIYKLLDLRVEYGNVDSLRNFMNVINCEMANIKMLNASVEDILVEIALTNMDSKTRLRFEDYIIEKAKPSVEDLNRFLNKELRIMSMIENRHECLICQKHHLTEHCNILITSDHRISLLRKRNICFKCMGHKHRPNKFCKVVVKCEICRKKHHTLLHV